MLNEIRDLPPELRVARRRLDGLYVEAGRRAHIMGRLDGSYAGFREVSKEVVNPPGGGSEGVWVEPLRLLDYVHFHVWDETHGLASLERCCEQYIREVGYSRFVHRFASHPYLKVEKHVWVPRHYEAVVIGLILTNESDQAQRLRLFTECRSHLSLGWPRRDAGRDTHRFDTHLQAILALDTSHPDWVALWGADQPPVAYHLGGFHSGLLNNGDLSAHGPGQSEAGRRCSCLQHDLFLSSPGEVRINLVIAGGDNGQDKAMTVYRHVMAHGDDLLQERIRHYRAIMQDTVRLETPDHALNKAFLWAKVGTEDFKHFDPDLGLCYFAGFPAYNFYFASDSFRILHGTICAGDFEETREILRMILKYQATEVGPDTLPGEIWHEMSTTGDRISPNFCTLDFPPLAEHVYGWTGDQAFLEEIYPNLTAAVEWGYLRDEDGDGILENGPEGEMADSAFEDTNMEGSHLQPNLAWCRALEAGARLADLVGDASSARRWRETASALRSNLNQVYWNETRRHFEETLRPDGCFDSSWRGTTVFDPEIVDEGKARFGLQRLLREEESLTDATSFFRWQESETAYTTWREHLSWYMVARGDRARFLLRNHLAEPGVTALCDMARVPFTVATPGHFPEVIGLDDPATPYVRGCAHQAWSSACGIVYPVIAGLFGVSPDAASHSVTIDPHLPTGWPHMRLIGLRVGDHRLDITYHRYGERLEAKLRNDGSAPLVARLGFPLPLFSEITTVTINGTSLSIPDPRLSIRPTPEDIHAYVETIVAAGESSVVALRYRPTYLELSADTYQKRTRPGAQTAISLCLTNKGSRSAKGGLRLDFPREWQGPQAHLGKAIELGPDEEREFTFNVEVPSAITEGYHTLWARFESAPNAIVARPMYLPVFGSVEIRVDGRGVTKEGRAYTLKVSVGNLTAQEITAQASVDLSPGIVSASSTARLTLEPGRVAETAFALTADQAGEFALPVKVTAPGIIRQVNHRIKVLPRDRLFVLYSGFLGCPIASGDDLEVVNMPANYVVRKPHVMEQLLPGADVVLTSDQHDAVFTDEQIEALVRYVADGGKLLLFCYWSSAWGRGFHDTYGNLAGTKLAEILPLNMKRGIGQGRGVQLESVGRGIFGDIAWGTCPPYDFNLAEARRQADVWASADDGHPLLAIGNYGRGRVMAIAIDCFGYGSYGTFLRWPGVPAMIRQAVLYLGRGSG